MKELNLLKELKVQESIAFISLVKNFIIADKKIDVNEKKILERYMISLQIKEDEICDLTQNMAIDSLRESTMRIKSLIYFELLGIALVDGEYENCEIEYLENLAKEFQIPRFKLMSFANFYFDYPKLKKLSIEEKNKKLDLIIN